MSRRIEAIRSGLVRFRMQSLPGLCQLYDLHYDWTRFWGAGQVGADDGQERQVAFTSLSDLAAGKDADAVGVEEQADHHGRIERRGAAGFVLVEGMDRGEIEPGDDIEEEEDEVILRELGGGGVGLLGVEIGGPGAIGFAARGVHDRSRMRIGVISRIRAPSLKA